MSTAGTQSIGIVATSSSGVSSSAFANCSAAQCVVNVDASAGTDTFKITLYDAVNGGGNALSSGSLTQSVPAGILTTVNVTFAGQVAQMSLTATPATLSGGVPGASVLGVTAKDAGGNIIIASGGTYSPAITLSDSDTSGATSLSSTSITGPGQTATLSYTGASIAPVTVTASASGVPSAAATISFTTSTPTPSASATPAAVAVNPSSLSFSGDSPSDAQNITVSEAGYSGGFSVSSTCASIANISGSGTAFTVTPVGPGTCNAAFTDTNGNDAVLPIVVTVTTGSGQ